MTKQSQLDNDRELLERWKKERLLPSLGQAPAAIDALLAAQDRISRAEERALTESKFPTPKEEPAQSISCDNDNFRCDINGRLLGLCPECGKEFTKPLARRLGDKVHEAHDKGYSLAQCFNFETGTIDIPPRIDVGREECKHIFQKSTLKDINGYWFQCVNCGKKEDWSKTTTPPDEEKSRGKERLPLEKQQPDDELLENWEKKWSCGGCREGCWQRVAYPPCGDCGNELKFIRSLIRAVEQKTRSEERERIIPLVKAISEQASSIRNDWSNPRSECREIWRLCDVILSDNRSTNE